MKLSRTSNFIASCEHKVNVMDARTMAGSERRSNSECPSYNKKMTFKRGSRRDPDWGSTFCTDLRENLTGVPICIICQGC